MRARDVTTEFESVLSPYTAFCIGLEQFFLATCSLFGSLPHEPLVPLVPSISKTTVDHREILATSYTGYSNHEHKGRNGTALPTDQRHHEATLVPACPMNIRCHDHFARPEALHGVKALT